MKRFITVLMMILSTTTIASAQAKSESALMEEFKRCERGIASADDMETILSMDANAKDIYAKQMREFVNNEINSRSKRSICARATADEYELYTKAIDTAKSRSKDPEFKKLTYAEVGFYLDCGDDLSPFLKNIHPEYIRNDDHGLTNNTIHMIKSMGPLLTLKGTDGRTVKEYVRDMLRYAHASNSDTLVGVYRRVLGRIETTLMDLPDSAARCATGLESAKKL